MSEENLGDRGAKYGWGTVRLAALVIWSSSTAGWSALHPVASFVGSSRFGVQAVIGSTGALINTGVTSLRVSVMLLLLAAMLLLRDIQIYDGTLAVYLLKTTVGDAMAGKVDAPAWRIGFCVVAFASIAFGAWLYSTGDTHSVTATTRYMWVFMVLVVIQFLCEWADVHLEHLAFFRHRVSFELCNLFVLVMLPLHPYERQVVEFDLVICTWYRAANYCIVLARQSRLSSEIMLAIIRLYGLFHHPFTRYRVVTDPALASAVLRASSFKGDCIEAKIATPAWAPVISLESIDGPRWDRMRADFNRVLRLLPPPGELRAITERRVQQLMQRRVIVDAEAIVRLSLTIFVEYTVGVTDWDDLELVAQASWEWRREIACKGHGDLGLKKAAVNAIVRLIQDSDRLGELFGEGWCDPERYSLIAQPLLLSPAINTCDIMVAVARGGRDCTLVDAIRALHPFPIFERYLKNPLIDADGKQLLPGGTQVLMFADDFVDAGERWSIFGAGPRSCAGASLALNPYLRVLRDNLLGYNLFRPAINHRYSGRNNDAAMSPGEMAYFVGTILRVILWPVQDFKNLSTES